MLASNHYGSVNKERWSEIALYQMTMSLGNDRDVRLHVNIRTIHIAGSEKNRLHVGYNNKKPSVRHILTTQGACTYMVTRSNFEADPRRYQKHDAKATTLWWPMLEIADSYVWYVLMLMRLEFVVSGGVWYSWLKSLLELTEEIGRVD